MMKKLITIVLAVTMLICIAPAANADNIKVICNGEPLNTDVEPVMIDNSVYVPVGNICRSMGATVIWNEQIQVATISFGNDTFSIYVGSTYMEKNGYRLTNSSTPFIERERVMVPLRLLSSCLGYSVDWDNNTYTAYVFNPKNIFYKISDTNAITFSSKYNSTQDIAIAFCPTGANSLPDFYKVFLVYNTQDYPSYNLSDSFCFYTSSSDWHSPFGIRAVENIDGDYITGNTHFTGGNHAYTNTSEGSPTAALKYIEFFADDKPISGGEGYCDKLKIRWINGVAATNTKRVDGSGRFVMDEEHIAVFDGTQWTETVTLLPKEEILIDFVYGFQAEIRGIWDGTVTYGNKDTTPVTFDGSTGSYPGFSDVNSVTCVKNTNCLSITLDTEFGIGNRKHFFTDKNGAFTTNYGKVYLNIVNGNSIHGHAGESYSYRGTYRFYSLEK